jgi:hypothetical protein
MDMARETLQPASTTGHRDGVPGTKERTQPFHRVQEDIEWLVWDAVYPVGNSIPPS